MHCVFLASSLKSVVVCEHGELVLQIQGYIISRHLRLYLLQGSKEMMQRLFQPEQDNSLSFLAKLSKLSFECFWTMCLFVFIVICVHIRSIVWRTFKIIYRNFNSKNISSSLSSQRKRLLVDRRSNETG